MLLPTHIFYIDTTYIAYMWMGTPGYIESLVILLSLYEFYIVLEIASCRNLSIRDLNG